MAQEAVQIIKRAEEEAKNIIVSAEKEAFQIVETAEKDSFESKKELVDALKTDFYNAVEKAKSDAEKISRENLLKVSDKTEKLKKDLLKNKDIAITEVLKKVLEG